MGTCINRRTWLQQSALWASALCCTPASWAKAGQTKPNFVFILIDDLGWKDCGFMGSLYYETPRIDRLAEQGMAFTNAYANAPNCAPSRACILSGQYTPRHGIYTVGSAERGQSRDRQLIPIQNTTRLPVAIPTLADACKRNGYATGHFGKWHLGDDPTHQPLARGFDTYFERHLDGYEAFHFKRKNFSDAPEPEYLTDRLTEEACHFIEVHQHEPFFVNLWHHAVHVPHQAKQNEIAKYKNKPGVASHTDPTYAAMIDSVDQSVGKILDQLDALHLADNTVVVFFSDNGGFGPITSMHPLRGAKGMLYEGGIREPLIVRWPNRIQAGSRCATPVMGIDFYPTFLALMGDQHLPGQVLDGQNLLPLLEQRGEIPREALFWHFPAYLESYKDGIGPWRTTPASAIRLGDYKLIEFFEEGTLELYNIQDDPGETTNLAQTLPSKRDELHARLKAWQYAIKAPIPRQKNPEYQPSEN